MAKLQDSNFDISWRVGRIQSLGRSHDGKIRRVKIEYKNSTEKTLRVTERTVREIAVLHHEGDVVLVDELNAAAACVNFLQCRRSPLVQPVGECQIMLSDQLPSLDLTLCCGECEEQEGVKESSSA